MSTAGRTGWVGARLAAVVALGLAPAGCGRRAANLVTITGSDTMVILAQRWGDAYMEAHPGTIIRMTGGGSGAGITALIGGGTDLCAASRPLTPEEFERVKARRGAEAREIPVALDGIAIYVNGKNRVKALTLDQVRQIYTGTIRDWKVVGGQKGPIATLGREPESGTAAWFREHAQAGEEPASGVRILPGGEAMVTAVAGDPLAIGYASLLGAKGVRVVAVSPRKGKAAVAPSRATISAGMYPISRKLYFYAAGEPTGLTADFVAWTLSPDGQKVCQEAGYIPLAKPRPAAIRKAGARKAVPARKLAAKKRK